MKNNTIRRGGFTASAAGGLLVLALALGTTGCAPQNPTETTAGSPATQTSAAPSQPGSTATESAVATPTAKAATAAPAPTEEAKDTGPILPASVPVSLSIPAIGVNSQLVPLGQEADGTMEVPSGEPGTPGGWYKYSPSPGELGPSVILGHVNTVASPEGLFFKLHELTPGQEFSVQRADGVVAVFRVDKLAVVKKATFPTLSVYGNTPRAEIRLITCGGFDPASGEYLDNTVVYGHLVSSHGS